MIHNPLLALDSWFEDHLKNGQSPADFNASKSVCDLLQDAHNVQEIPSLNTTSHLALAPETIVRFRCMVQDTNLGPEIYLSLHEVNDPTTDQKKLRCLKYRDADLADMDQFNEGRIPNEFLDERGVVYCISPPGESDWLKESDQPSIDEKISTMSLNDQNQAGSDAQASLKFPLPGVSHASAIVKLYGTDKNIAVGSEIEIIGILNRPSPSRTTTDSGDADFDLPKPTFPNTPIVHALSVKALKNKDVVPISEEDITNVRQQANDIRAQLLEYLGNTFGGDLVVAEYVLLQLLSRVTSKRGAFALGQFSLNVTEFPTESIGSDMGKGEANSKPFASVNLLTSKVSNILKKILPAFIELPLSLNVLNSTSFYPRSTDENLLAGVLQLIDGTCVLVDETVLEEGTLKDQGVKNIQALNKVIQQQLLGYAYPFHEFDLSTDLGFIVVSRAKSMFPCHCMVPLNNSSTIPLQSLEDNNSLNISEQVLCNFRKYLHILKYLDYDIPESISQHIQERFVEARKAASSQSLPLPTQDDLMMQLNLARLVSLSFGSTELTQELFDYTLNLEKTRTSRLEPAAAAQPQK
ncbi:hypothetical protein VKS41_004805 [Umbelopsis sp. WA50703]